MFNVFKPKIKKSLFFFASRINESIFMREKKKGSSYMKCRYEREKKSCKARTFLMNKREEFATSAA